MWNITLHCLSVLWPAVLLHPPVQLLSLLPNRHQSNRQQFVLYVNVTSSLENKECYYNTETRTVYQIQRFRCSDEPYGYGCLIFLLMFYSQNVCPSMWLVQKMCAVGKIWWVHFTSGLLQTQVEKKNTKVTTIEINLIKVGRLGELPSYKGW